MSREITFSESLPEDPVQVRLAGLAKPRHPLLGISRSS